MRGWFASAAEQKDLPLVPVVLVGGSTAHASVCKCLQSRTHLKDAPLARQGPKTQPLRGKMHFWKRNRELELGEAKAPGLCFTGHLVLPPPALQLLNGMRKSFKKLLEGVSVSLAGSVSV